MDVTIGISYPFSICAVGESLASYQWLIFFQIDEPLFVILAFMKFIRKSSLFLAALILVVHLSPLSADSPTIIKGNKAAALDDFFVRAAAFGFSGALLVSQDDDILLSKGYGWANREKEIPVTSQTAFSVASITKMFTAASIMLLEQEGKLKTSDPLSAHLEGVPPDKANITIHQVLCHMSGFDDQYAATGISDRDLAVQKILQLKLIAAPGERYSYSNDGYDLLAAIIEIVSGKSYPEFIHERLLKPAGMKSTGFWGEKAIWPENLVAHGYNMETDYGSQVGRQDFWSDRGSGDMITTVEDLHRWDTALRKGTILSPEIQKKMTGLYATMPNGWHYGYGIMTFTTPRGTTGLYHGGGDVPSGWTAEFKRYIDERTTTIVLVNSMMDEVGLRNAARDSLPAILFGGDSSYPPAWSSVPFKPDPYKGVFELSDKDRITIAYRRGQLVAMGEGQQAIGMLIGYKTDRNASLEAMNQRVASALSATLDGHSSPDIPPDQWKSLLAEKGALKKFEVLGTAPVNPEEISTTYARLHFENGTEVLRWIWSNDRLTEILDGTDYPVIAPLVRIATDKFLGYHLLMKTTVQAEFDLKEGELTLRSDYGVGKAKKVISISHHSPLNRLNYRRTFKILLGSSNPTEATVLETEKLKVWLR
jgi:CubicO group peptidase (beta-lactamase class C family)